MKYKIINKTSDKCIASDACVAKTFWERLMGLMFKKSISADEALIFYDVSSIHMFFMRFPIDVLYLDKGMKVLKIKHSLLPWMMSYCPGAKITIELPSQKAKNTFIKIGDILEFID